MRYPATQYLFLLCIYACSIMDGYSLPKAPCEPLNRYTNICPDTLFNIKGYCIRRFEKKDILLKERARNRRINHQSFELPIDGQVFMDLFIPSKAGEPGMEDITTEVSVRSMPDNEKKDIYLYSSTSDYSGFATQFCENKQPVDDAVRIVFSSDKYYVLDKSDQYCYQIIYISGEWVRDIATTKLQKKIFSVNRPYVSLSEGNMDIYLLTKQKEVKELVPVGFKLWKTVPGIFSN